MVSLVAEVKKLARWLDRGLGHIAALMVWFYRGLISKRLPKVCIFTPSCSVYASVCWRRFGLVGGGKLVKARLSRCRGGVFQGRDDPPHVSS